MNSLNVFKLHHVVVDICHTEFEVHSVNYKPSFFPLALWLKQKKPQMQVEKMGFSNPSTDQEEIRYLLYLWVQIEREDCKQTFKFSWLHSEIWPAKLTL